MEVSPQQVRTHEFSTAKRGLDPGEVGAFLAEVADELERAQNHATAMEARARAAVQRIQELTEAAAAPAAPVAPAEASAPTPSAEQAETISRTLLLAQRTADTAIAEAREEAERLVATASEEATGMVDAAREERAQLIETARDEASREGEEERARVQAEAEVMRARRDALRDDVEHLEQFLVAQRERLRDAATTLIDLTERIPGGLGHAAEPLLASLDDETSDEAVSDDETSDTGGTVEDGEDGAIIATDDVEWGSPDDAPGDDREWSPPGGVDDPTPVDTGRGDGDPVPTARADDPAGGSSADLSFDLSDER